MLEYPLNKFNETVKINLATYSKHESTISDDHYYTLFRRLNTDVVKWFGVDPKFNPSESPYMSMSGNPVTFNDVLGDIVEYGDKKTQSWKERRAIRREVRRNMKNDPAFKALVRTQKSQRNVIHRYVRETDANNPNILPSQAVTNPITTNTSVINTNTTVNVYKYNSFGTNIPQLQIGFTPNTNIVSNPGNAQQVASSLSQLFSINPEAVAVTHGSTSAPMEQGGKTPAQLNETQIYTINGVSNPNFTVSDLVKSRGEAAGQLLIQNGVDPNKIVVGSNKYSGRIGAIIKATTIE